MYAVICLPRMDVDKTTFDWGNGCLMRGVGKDVRACDVLWHTANARNHRVTVINGRGLLCDDAKVCFTIARVFSMHDQL